MEKSPKRTSRIPGPEAAKRIDYPSALNAEQLSVVMHPGGPMLVLAGAGSGKTRTVVYRVARLLETGEPPSTILLLTFTNRAAREMLSRVENLLGRSGSGIMGGTFHSVGNRILRRYGQLLGYPPNYGILDREDAQELMAQAATDVLPELPARRLPGAAVLLEIYSFVINTGTSLSEVVAARYPQFVDEQDHMQAVFRRYLQRKRQANLMDYDDLLLNWLLLLREQPQVRQALATRFRHILVDEYQDTNRLQAEVVDTMLGGDRNLLVVGDDAQSIYAFRGACYANILTFPQRYPDCTVFHLSTNYRSLPPILALANASIAHNQNQFHKKLVAVREGVEKPLVVAAPSPELQAAYVAQRILELVDEGVKLAEIGVLYRNHSHSLELEVELTRRRIPYEVRSGLRFFEQRHVKDVLAHLRFVANPWDEVAFARMAKLRPRLGQRLVARIWECLPSGGDRLQAFLALDPQTCPLPQAAARSLEHLQTLLARLRRLQEKPGEMIREILASGYRDYVRAQLDNAPSRLEDLEQLALFADTYERLSDFLDEVTLMNELSGEDLEAWPGEGERITLSTVHRAKGLEWQVVFVIWLAEGSFPSARAEDLEEERRLFYVACTRAKDALYLCYPLTARDRYRVDILINPSRFLAELPNNLYQRVLVEPPPSPELCEEPSGYQCPDFLPRDKAN
ncbi:MAG: ATP-dependent helicase [Thermoanaerobaculaceae bacterium]